MPDYIVVPVRSARDMKDFVDLPWALYKGDTNWIPPLKKMVREILTPGKHPYWEFSGRELFLLRDGNRTVGRIAAIVDRNFNDYHGEKAGAWGFFECVDDQSGADLLFAAAGEWLRRQGMDYMHGPFNPSTNYEIGMLVEGFNSPPVLMMTYNPGYYLRLVEGSGQVKEKDLLAFRFFRDHKLPDWVSRIVGKIMDKGEISLRHVDMKRLDDEVALMNRLYKAAWADNWGFVPATDAEIAVQAKELKSIIEPKLAFFIYHGEEPVGVCVILPDANPLLKAFNGKLGITAPFKFLLNRSKIRGARSILFGVKPAYQMMGVPFVALDYIMKIREEFPQFEEIEMSWTLEDNNSVNDLLEDLGGELYKRYRIYRKDF